ncbi:unnamed protein product [Rotaria magnacalcarata]
MGSDTSKPKKHPTQLTEEEVQLLLKNTRFNRKQIMEWHQGFLCYSYVMIHCPLIVSKMRNKQMSNILSMNVSDEQIRKSFRKEQSLASIARLRDDMGAPAPKRRKNKVIIDEYLIKLWLFYDEGLLDIPSFLKAAGLRYFERPPKR